MPGENAKIVRALIERWNAHDRSLGAVAEHLDPAIQLQSPLSSVVGVPYLGHTGMEQWARDVDEQFAEWHVSLEEVRETDDVVVAIGAVHGRGRGSGIAIDFAAATLVYFGADHLIKRVHIYADVDEALKAAGLA